jgi:hypothetical protein
MNMESLLVYAGVALGGWLLRHLGLGAGAKLPGASAPVSPSGHVPLMATLKADIDQIVKSAVEAAVKQAVEDIKTAAAPPSLAK